MIQLDFFPKTMNVLWFPIGDRNTPSTRIMCFNVSDWMNENNINSIIYDNHQMSDLVGVDTFIVQKRFDEEVQKICREWKAWGREIIYIIDDLYEEGFPMAKIAHKVVCGSEYIKEWIRPHTDAKLYVMDDAYETPRDFYKQDYQTDKPKAVWFGTLLHFPQAEQIRYLIEWLGYQYDTITLHPKATKQWNCDTIWDELLTYDLVVIPYLGTLPPYELAKGNNRLTQSMVLGLPVITSPIPAYLPIVKQMKNGIICYNNTVEDWEMYLRMLHPWQVRKGIGEKAREDVIDKYNIDAVGAKWKEILIDDKI